MKKRNLLLVICIPFFHSCVIDIKGYKVGYNALSDEDRKMVVITDTSLPVCELKNDGKVYAITSAQLEECLALSDSSLVYEWSANCHSEACISIPACQKYCNERGLKLFVIAEYYDAEMMRVQNFGEYPLFIANHLHYDTDKCNKLNARFFNTFFTEKKPEGDLKYSRFHLFYGKKYKRSINKLF